MFSSLLDRLVLAGLLLGMATGTVWAQGGLPSGVQWGMSPAEVREAVPGVQPVRRPQTVAGAVGSWRVPGVAQDDLLFDETFFFADQALQRVELLHQGDPDESGDAFERLLSALRARYGPELQLYGGMSSLDAGSASWVVDDTDILAMQTGPTGQVRVRLIYKARVLKDASEL